MQSLIVNDCYGYNEPQLVPKLLLQVSVKELHNNLVSATKDVGLKEARDEDDNIIICHSTLHPLLPPQLLKMPSRYKVMCGCECCISSKSMHSSLLSWRYCYLKKNSRISEKIPKIESLGKKKIRIYETCKNTVMQNWRHIYSKAYAMAKATICAYSQSDHALPH